jgi:hypothetical protein
MKIDLQKGDSKSRLSFTRWALGIVGNTVDDRGTAATDFVKESSEQVVVVEYDPDEFTLEIDGHKQPVDRLDETLESWKNKSILFETTTLGFSEIFLLTRVLYHAGMKSLSFLYVEPAEYAHSRRTPLLHRRDFELSELVPGYRGIPGAGVMMSDLANERAVFFLGYEERRLDRALEDFQMLRPDNCAIVFGVPAFQAGWEMDAFANNIRVINERGIAGGVFFCGAENPSGAFDVLARVKDELHDGERLVVAPIGTKPNGLGAALFATVNPRVGLLYDHPKRRQKRTERTANWHLYNVEF